MLTHISCVSIHYRWYYMNKFCLDRHPIHDIKRLIKTDMYFSNAQARFLYKQLSILCRLRQKFQVFLLAEKLIVLVSMLCHRSLLLAEIPHISCILNVENNIWVFPYSSSIPEGVFGSWINFLELEYEDSFLSLERKSIKSVRIN